MSPKNKINTSRLLNISYIIFKVKVRWDELKVDFIWSWEESCAKGREVKCWAEGPNVVSTSVNLDAPTLPLLTALVKEVAAPRVDPDVISGKTGRRDVEVGDVITQVVPKEAPQ